MQEKLTRKYRNGLLKPEKLCRYYIYSICMEIQEYKLIIITIIIVIRKSRLKILENYCWSTLDKVNVVDHITVSALNVSLQLYDMRERVFQVALLSIMCVGCHGTLIGGTYMQMQTLCAYDAQFIDRATNPFLIVYL